MHKTIIPLTAVRVYSYYTTAMNQEKTIDFIGIGAPRSGSTWLAYCLEEHPNINFPQTFKTLPEGIFKKEIHFFSESLFRDNCAISNYQKGLKWYLNLFPPKKEGDICGEISVSYLADKKAAQIIYKHFPEAKILVTLRNPTKMIYSAYNWFRAVVHTRVPKDFDRAVQEGELENLKAEKALYHKHLQRYFRTFPRGNIKIILLDDIKKDPKKVMEDTYAFLGVSPKYTPQNLNVKIHSAVRPRFEFLRTAGQIFFKSLERLDLPKIYKGFSNSDFFYVLYWKLNLVPYNYPPMEQKTKEILIDYYREDIKKLESLINRDLTPWLQHKAEPRCATDSR